MMDSLTRFSDRVEYYVRYRPSYPEALLAYLEQQSLLAREQSRPRRVVADVGAGTGILSRLFLERGYRVYGVEPNEEMRAVADRELSPFGHYTSVAGQAEMTTLPVGSVDLIAVGQAFHWFDRPAARKEFRRILRPGALSLSGHALLGARQERVIKMIKMIMIHTFFPGGTSCRDVRRMGILRCDCIIAQMC